jgi:transposase
VVLGHSELSLQSYFQLEGKAQVKVVCMDLATHYRSLVGKHFPNAKIVAESLPCHPLGLRAVDCCRLCAATGITSKPEQSVKLQVYLQGYPALEPIYRFKQKLCYLLLKKHSNRKQCEKLIPRFLRAISDLEQSGFASLVQLGNTLSSWSEQIVAMWRFTRNNGITEGFHNKMETISRQAFGFRNFENYRLRVKVLCG